MGMLPAAVGNGLQNNPGSGLACYPLFYLTKANYRKLQLIGIVFHLPNRFSTNTPKSPANVPSHNKTPRCRPKTRNLTCSVRYVPTPGLPTTEKLLPFFSAGCWYLLRSSATRHKLKPRQQSDIFHREKKTKT